MRAPFVLRLRAVLPLIISFQRFLLVVSPSSSACTAVLTTDIKGAFRSDSRPYNFNGQHCIQAVANSVGVISSENQTGVLSLAGDAYSESRGKAQFRFGMKTFRQCHNLRAELFVCAGPNGIGNQLFTLMSGNASDQPFEPTLTKSLSTFRSKQTAQPEQ